MSTQQVPLSLKQLYLGEGFVFKAIHRQRLFLLSQTDNDSCLGRETQLTGMGGKSWIHGVGAHEEASVFLDQHVRNSHHLVLGMTRVGKTRLSSLLINQDIRNGQAVLVIDPKGDLDLIKDIHCATESVGRRHDLMILHAGFPDISAKYNPLKTYSSISEVATRVTAALCASGEAQAFKDFAWQYINLTAMALADMGVAVNYKNLARYVSRPKWLLSNYCDRVLSISMNHYEDEIEQIIVEYDMKCLKKKGNSPDMTREEAVCQFVGKFLQKKAGSLCSEKGCRDLLVDLYQASQLGDDYYHKITASLGPLLDKINKTAAGSIFSWESSGGLPEVSLEAAIQSKKIIYIGLNAMGNRVMSEAVGKALISDLISVCGRLYHRSQSGISLCVHVDEFSDIVQDDFVTLVNKAGGAGIKVTAYTQTVNDLGQAFSSRDKAKQLLGNFGTTTMLRIANKETAEVLTQCLQTMCARSTVPVSMSSDASQHLMTGFNTSNSDQVKETELSLVTQNDLFSLPKGHAFTLTNGGVLYKVRFPWLKNSMQASTTMENIIREVNQCD